MASNTWHCGLGRIVACAAVWMFFATLTIAVDLLYLGCSLSTAAGNNSKSKLAVRQENLNKSPIGLTMYGR